MRLWQGEAEQKSATKFGSSEFLQEISAVCVESFRQGRWEQQEGHCVPGGGKAAESKPDCAALQESNHLGI